MSRVQLYDASEVAHGIRETFMARPPKGEKRVPFGWPTTWQHVGDSLAVAYASDKWKKDGDYELYKHIAESRNRVLVQPGFLADRDDPGEGWGVIGPVVSFQKVPMPRHFAVLGYFEEANFHLHTRGTDEVPAFGTDPDDGIVKVVVRHAMLGASKIMWSEVSDRADQPFLFAYTQKSGPVIFIVGEELDVEKDGIVG